MKQRATSSAASPAWFAVALGALVLAASSIAAGSLYASDREQEEGDLSAAAARELAEEQEQAAADAAAEEARAEEKAERTLRKVLVSDLEKSITKDAQEEAEQEFSLIDGPVLETQCDPKGGTIDTLAKVQSFSCLAITEFTEGGGAEGYRYSAEVNYKAFSYRWRLGGGGV